MLNIRRVTKTFFVSRDQKIAYEFLFLIFARWAYPENEPNYILQ